MANYEVKKREKKVLVSGTLTALEKDIVSMYISQGFLILPKEERNTGHKITREDIVNWFKANKNDKGIKDFTAKEKEKIIDKNGKERTAGYLKAVKWFRTTYPDAYKEIQAKKNK